MITTVALGTARPPVTVAAQRHERRDVPATMVAGAFVPAGPCRIADTRTRTGYRRIDASTVRVTVVSACGVPADATAAALTVTVTNTTAAGYATVWPAGQSRPLASNLNWRRGETRANSALVALSYGSVDVHLDSTADVIVDVDGAFVPTAVAAAGRFVPITPQRALDTRTVGQPLIAGTALRVPLPMFVPADATALAATITITDSRGAGYVSVHPAGEHAVLSSILNTDAAGQTRAATVIAPVSADGLEVYSSGGGDIVVDVAGYVTGASAPVLADGLFVADAPRRVLDTRDSAVMSAGSARTLALPVEGVAAVAMNWTMVDAAADGWTAVSAAHTPWAGTSSLNAGRGETVANLSLAGVSAAGVVARVSVTTHLVADLQGWFTGRATQSAVLPDDGISPYGDLLPGPRDGAQRRVLVVGDSLAQQSLPSFVAALAGWHVDALVYGGTAVCDWVETARLVAAATRPDLVMFSFVGNALTPCTDHLQGSALLQRYLDDLDQLCAAVAPAPCIAVGQPVLGPWVTWTMPGTDEPTLSYRQLAAAGRWGYVDAGRVVENLDGTFAPLYRAPDGIHFTEAGALRYGAAMARYLLALVA